MNENGSQIPKTVKNPIKGVTHSPSLLKIICSSSKRVRSNYLQRIWISTISKWLIMDTWRSDVFFSVGEAATLLWRHGEVAVFGSTVYKIFALCAIMLRLVKFIISNVTHPSKSN